MGISSKSQEEISRSYFCAVAANADAIVDKNDRDENGIDMHLSKTISFPNGDEYDSQLDFQLKSVYSNQQYHFDKDDNIVYCLKVKNYRDLIRQSSNKRFLALLVLPSDEDEWVVQNQESLLIKKCMYYISLKGMPNTNNSETINIKIPKDNIFDKEHLLELFRSDAEEAVNGN